MEDKGKPQDIATQTEIPVSSIASKNAESVSFVNLVIKNKVLLGLVVAVIVIFILGGTLVQNYLINSKAQKFVNDGKSAVVKGDYKKAQDDYKQALAIKKNDPEILAHLIDAFSIEGNQKGQEDQSLKSSQPYIDEALKTGQNDVAALLAIGYAYETAGEYQKALESYYRAIKLDPKSADAWFHYGHAKEFLGQKDDAKKAYDTAYSLNPKNPSVLMVRANNLFSQGKKEEAFQAFKLASDTKDMNPTLKAEALTGAALVRGEQDNYSHVLEARDIAKEAANADPNFSPALATYGYYLFLTTRGEDLDTSYSYVKKAIEKNYKITRNYILLGQIFRAEKDYDGAISIINEAIKRAEVDNTILSPADRTLAKGDYTYELAKTYSMSKVGLDSFSLIKNAISLNPNVRKFIANDYKSNGIFNELSGNSEFLKLIGS